MTVGIFYSVLFYFYIILLAVENYILTYNSKTESNSGINRLLEYYYFRFITIELKCKNGFDPKRLGK